MTIKAIVGANNLHPFDDFPHHKETASVGRGPSVKASPRSTASQRRQALKAYMERQKLNA